MSIAQILILTAYSSGLVAGQLLFKIAAQRADFSSPAGFARLLTDPAFLCAAPLYAILIVLWVWVLTFTPLSKAYLFVALALAVTPLAAAPPQSRGRRARPLTLRMMKHSWLSFMSDHRPTRAERNGLRHGNAARIIFRFVPIVENSPFGTRVGSNCSPLCRRYSLSRLRSLPGTLSAQE